MNEKPAVTLLSIALAIAAFAGVFAFAGVQVASAGHTGGEVIVNASGGSGVDNTTIQGGINYAHPGDTVIVQSGTYNETVVVNKSVNVVAEDGAVLNGSTLSNPTAAFNITNYQANITDTAIRGFEIENYDTGVTIHGTDFTGGLDMYNVTVLNNSFDVSGGAIEVHHESGQFELVTISNNTVSNAASGVSVYVNGSTSTENVTVLDNSFTGVSGAAISLWTQNSASLTDVNLLGNDGSTVTTGLDVTVANTGSITDINVSANDFSNTDTPIQITSGGGTDPSISGVDVLLNALNQSTNAGLSIESPSSTLSISTVNVSRNTFEGSGAGIAIDVGASSTVTDLNVSGNALNETDGTGLNLTVRGDASVDGVDVLANNASGNAEHGFTVVTTGSSPTVSNLDVTGNLFTGSGSHSVFLHPSAGTIENVTVESNALNESSVAGFEIDTRNSATVENVTLLENDLRESAYGLLLDLRNSSTVRDFNATNNLFNGSSSSDLNGILLHAGETAGSTATLSNVTIYENVLSGRADTNDGSVRIFSEGSATVRDVLIERNDIRNASDGLVVETEESGTIDDVNVTNNAITNASDDAIFVQSLGEDVSDITIHQNALNETGDDGIDFEANEGGNITSVRVESNALQNNADNGIAIGVTANSNLSDLYVTTNLIRNNTDDAINMLVEDGRMHNVTVFENGLNASGDVGLAATGSGTGTISDVLVQRNNVSQSGDDGILFKAWEQSSISAVNVTNNLVNGSTDDGLRIEATNGTVQNVTVFENGLNQSGDVGLLVATAGTGQVSDVLVDTNDLTNNANFGVLVSSEDTSTVSGLNITSALTSGASSAGVALSAGTAASGSDATIRNVSISSSGLNETGGIGLFVQAYGTSNISDLALDTVTLKNNTLGMYVEANESATIENVSVTDVLASNSTSDAVTLVAGAPSIDTDATIRNVSFTNAGLNESGGTGLVIESYDTSVVSDVSLDTVDASNNSAGLRVYANGDSTVSGLSVDTVVFGGSETTAAAGVLRAGSGQGSTATISDVSFTSTGFNETQTHPGLVLKAHGGTIDGVSLDTVIANNNSAGLQIYANRSGRVANISADTALFGENTGDAVSIQAGLASGSSTIVENVSFTNAGLNESGGTGLLIEAYGSSSISEVSLDTVDARNNTQGARVFAADSATISDIDATSVLFGEAQQRAVELQAGVSGAGSSATITDVSFDTVGLNRSASGSGLRLEAWGTSEITDVSLDTVTLSNNTVGLRVFANGDSRIANVTSRTALFADSASRAVRLRAGRPDQSADATIANVSFIESGLNETANGAGLLIEGYGTSQVSEVSLDTIDARDNDRGLVVRARENATISNLAVTSALFGNSSASAGVLSAGENAGSAAAIRNVSFDTVGLNESADTGLVLDAERSATIHNVSLETVIASNNTDGLHVYANDSATISDVSTDTVLFGDNADDAGIVRAGVQDGSSAVIRNLDFASTGFNESGGVGLALIANGESRLSDVSLDTVIASDNTEGLHVYANDDSTIANISAQTALFAESHGDAAVIRAGLQADSAATIRNVSFDTAGFNESSGTGLSLLANGDSTLVDVSLETVIASNNTGNTGLYVHANDSSRIADLAVNTGLFSEGQVGAHLLSGWPGTSGTATIANVSFESVGLNQTTGTGLLVESWGQGSITNVSLDTAEVSDNVKGLVFASYNTSSISEVSLDTVRVRNNTAGTVIEANDDSTIESVDIRNTLQSNNSDTAVRFVAAGGTVRDVRFTRSAANESGVGVGIGGTAGGTFENVKVFEALIIDNQVGINVTETAPVAGVRIQRSLISNNTRGAVNHNPDAILDARNNWWGASSGPSSPTDSDAPFADPVTGKLANGEGDTVSEDPDDPGVSNVRFDPGLAGKNRCSGDPQLIDPVPNRTFSVSVSGQEISGELRDFVGFCIWERSVLPFTADHEDAETKVQNTKIFLETSGEVQVTGEGTNRPYITVFGDDEPVGLSMEKVTGAQTERFAGERVQLIAVRANDSEGLRGTFTTTQSINSTTGNVTFGTNAVTNVEIRNVGTLDASGQIQTSYTPPRPGDYLLALATVESGDGFRVTDDEEIGFNVLNDSAIIVGTTVITVQKTNSTVSATPDAVEPGGTFTFDAKSNIDSDNVSHAVVLYDKDEFENKVTTVNSTVSRENGNVIFNITGTSDGESFLLSINATTGGTVNNITTSGALDGVNSTSKVVLFADSRENIMLDTDANFPTGTYQWVHLAVASNNFTKRSTDEGTVVLAEEFPDIALSRTSVGFGRVTVGDSVTRSFTVSNEQGAADTLSITSTKIVGANAGAFSIVSGGGSRTLAPGESVKVRVRFSPRSAGGKKARLEIASNDPDEPTVTVSLSGRGETEAQVPPAPPAQPPEVSVSQPNRSRASIQVSNVAPNVTINVTIPGGVGSDVIQILGLDVRTADTVPGSFGLDISTRRRPPTGTPALDIVGEVGRYFEVTSRDITDDQIKGVQFRFRVKASRLGDRAPGNVVLYRFHDGEWQALPTTFRERRGDFYRFTATSPGFSTFAVGFTAARFEVSLTSLSPRTVTVGEEATASATITNTGDGEGTLTVPLTANGEQIDSRNVTLAPGEATEVSFTVSFDEPGSYDLAINGTDVGTLVVEAVTPTPTPTPTTPTPTPTTPTPTPTTPTPTPTTPTPTPTTPTPTPTTPTPTPTPTEEEPGGGIPGLVIALIVIVLLAIAGAALYFREEIEERLDEVLGNR